MTTWPGGTTGGGEGGGAGNGANFGDWGSGFWLGFVRLTSWIKEVS